MTIAKAAEKAREKFKCGKEVLPEDKLPLNKYEYTPKKTSNKTTSRKCFCL